MRKLTILVVILSLFAVSACRKKTPMEPEPTDIDPLRSVIFDSMVVQKDGSLKLYGEHLFANDSDIDSCGFYLLTDKDVVYFNLDRADSLVNRKFWRTYRNLDAMKTYYIGTWVIVHNNHFLKLTDSIRNVHFDTTLIHCHPIPNQLTLSGLMTGAEAYTSISDVVPTSNNFQFNATTNNHSINFIFNQIPLSGIYITGDSTRKNYNNVSVKLDNAYALPYDTVYVLQTSPTTIDVTFCGLKYISSQYFASKLSVTCNL